MSLEQEVMSQMKAAMKEKNSIALESLRAIKSELLLLKTASGDGTVDEAKEIALLQKLVKQRKEAAEQFENSGRNDAAEKELAQAQVIQTFLPKQMSEEELTEYLKGVIEKVGANSAKEMGKVMGVATKELAGKAEGKVISAKVRELLG